MTFFSSAWASARALSPTPPLCVLARLYPPRLIFCLWFRQTQDKIEGPWTDYANFLYYITFKSSRVTFLYILLSLSLKWPCRWTRAVILCVSDLSRRIICLRRIIPLFRVVLTAPVWHLSCFMYYRDVHILNVWEVFLDKYTHWYIHTMQEIYFASYLAIIEESCKSQIMASARRVTYITWKKILH